MQFLLPVGGLAERRGKAAKSQEKGDPIFQQVIFSKITLMPLFGFDLFLKKSKYFIK